MSVADHPEASRLVRIAARQSPVARDEAYYQYLLGIDHSTDAGGMPCYCALCDPDTGPSANPARRRAEEDAWRDLPDWGAGQSLHQADGSGIPCLCQVCDARRGEPRYRSLLD